MSFVLRRRYAMIAIAASTIAGFVSGAPLAHAQPRPLDVPFVPTPDHIVEAMLKLAKPTKDDFLVDLGSGDGRIPITAAKLYGTRGLGVDLNPARIKEARENAQKAGVSDRVEFIEGDLFKTDFQKASVLTMYLLPDVNMALRPKILDMKPGTRVVSHAFHMDDWKADASEQSDFRHIFFWIVPAKISGTWAGTLGSGKLELEFHQKFQDVTGKGTLDGKPVTIAAGRIAGEQVDLVLSLPERKQSRLRISLKGGGLEGDGARLIRK